MTTTLTCPECGSDVAGVSGAVCAACGAPIQSTGQDKRKHTQSFFVRHFERILLVGSLLVLALATLVFWAIPHFSPLSMEDALQVSPLTAMFRLPTEAFANKSPEYANPFITVLYILLTLAIVGAVLSAQRGRLPFIRRIAGLNAIDEAVGRATEMGRPILFSGGLAGIGIVSLQALAVGSHIGRFAARYGTRLIVPVCDPTMLPITEQVLREVYNSEGKPEGYRPEDVRYLSERQFAYAAGVTGILHQEKVAASFLFGQFYAESLVLAENGQAVGAIQVAGTPDLLQTPFFVVTCDYTIIGDEYYAASAYLSREPTQLGSLTGQDIGKAMIFILVIVGIAWSIFSPATNPIMHWLGGTVPK